MQATNKPMPHLLTMNAGSSSIKIALFVLDNESVKKLSEAAIENIGQSSASLAADDKIKQISTQDHAAATHILMQWLAEKVSTNTITAVGHRIVHGGPKYYQAQLATDEVLESLRGLAAFDPEHLPVELELVETVQQVLPQAQHILCFDTAFHHNLPAQARLLPIPRKLSEKGIRRYGFHGLSYAYILDELRRVEGDAAANGKVIIAHLGSGASLDALHNGKSIDTTMSMTPASGIPMSTRSGDLDPGLALYIAKTEGYEAERFNHMVNFESGLLGISETTADMKRLLEAEYEDTRAKDAIDVFCYNTKKQIGALTAALGGLNTLVFTGGMGENAPKIRKRVCEGLDFLGINLDAARNEEGARLISADDSRIGVHVIHTDEAVTIARETADLINHKNEVQQL